MLAGVSIVSSGMQQIFCRTMQQKHKLSSHELLANTAPAQSWTLLLAGPMLDFYISRSWVTQYAWSLPACITMIASCSMAVGVNLSQFMCLGRFSAVSFQVLGHLKTFLVLLGGWLFLHDQISGRQFGGMCLAVSGMVAYGVATSRAVVDKSTSLQSAQQPLLQSSDDQSANFKGTVNHLPSGNAPHGSITQMPHQALIPPKSVV